MTRDVLIHVSVETARGKRKCHHNRKHSISQGDLCLVIKSGAYNSPKNYCLECATDILSKAKEKLQNLISNLSDDTY